MSTEVEKPLPHLMSKTEMLSEVQLSYPCVWDKMRKDLFPRGKVVGGKTFWVRSEVMEWISNCPRQVLKGDPKSKRGK